MLPALGLVKALPTGEHDIGSGEQQLLEQCDLGRSVFERRKFVHAVVDANIAAQEIREAKRHRRVVPGDQLVMVTCR